MTQLNRNNITNLYLYGQLNTPANLLDSNIIRPKDNNVAIREPNDTSIEVEVPEFMTTGGGRFALPSQFELIQKFFDPNTSISAGTYDKLAINNQINDGQFFAWSMQQYSYDDSNLTGGIDDFLDRVWVYNSMLFQISDGTQFIVDANGNRRIENLAIEPYLNPNENLIENFDFSSNDLQTSILNSLVGSSIDPSGIGRKVWIDFVNSNLLPRIQTYKQSDFEQDTLKNQQWEIGSTAGLLKINSLKDDFRNGLFNDGIIRFLDNENKPILYGTVNADSLTAAKVTPNLTPNLYEFLDNGVVLIGAGGNDILSGNYIVPERGSSNDVLIGGEGQDTLYGHSGEDTAIFSDDFENYAYSISEDKKTITFAHVISPQTDDGVDTLKNIEWGQFKDGRVPLGNARLASATTAPPRIIPLPLEDGVLDTESIKAIDTTVSPNPNDPPTPPHVSLTMPVAMLDGNVDYTLNISPYKPDTQYNISYILDTSASMDAVELQKAKDAYTNLTNYFINNGLAENINFAVVGFSRSATLYKNLTAQQAISTIQGLTSSPAIEGTEYDNALYQGFNFLSQSPLNALNTTNIAYFVSDGRSDISTNFYHDDAQRLRNFANVQAFGIYDPTDPGGVTSSQINFVDSNNGVLVNNINDLSGELQKSGLAGKISGINILVDGVVVDTIQPSELIDSPLGLTYEGSVENLDVSVDAKNIITAQVVFNDNTANTSVDYTVTAGDGKLIDGNGSPIDESGNTSGDENPFEKIRNGGVSNDDITLGYADLGANGGAGADYIVGNKRDNQLDGGAGNDTIMGHQGNDTIITGAGTNKVNGGEGIDTAVYEDIAYQGNNNISLRQAANTVSYNNTDTLTDVEYIQFSDVRLSAKTLQITPMLEGNDVNVSELKTGNATAKFTLNLSTPAPGNVQFNYQTVDGDAVAGSDYIAKSGQITIAAGQTSATVEVAVIGDNQYDELTEAFALKLSAITGATFADNQTEYTLVTNIENRVQDLNLIGDAQANTLTGGAGDDLIDGQGNNDYLAGEGGNDTLIGGSGVDTLVGNTGNDAYVVDATGDVISETSTSATEIDTVQSSVTYSLGSNLENLTLTGTSAINGTGNTLNNSITGNTAANTLSGGTGNDTMTGGTGNDTYIIDSTDDVLSETSTSATEIDTVQSSVTYNLGSNLENLTLTGTGAINGTGNSLNNSMTGNSTHNQMDGGTGNDTLVAYSGNDNLIGGTGDDSLNGGYGEDSLTGGTGNDSLDGSYHNDTLDGGTGNDTMTGGTGNDTYIVDATGDVLSETSTVSTEIDNVNASVSYTLSANVENLTLTGTGAINGIGNSLNNNITGNSTHNQIDGGTGNDTLIAYSGNDNLTGGTGNDSLNGGYGNDSLTGGTGNDSLDGSYHNDTLDGGTGNDTMTGGTGNDTYVVDVIGDVINETSTAATEIDTVQSSVTYNLGSNVEHLTLDGTGAINGTGNSLNNTITGNSANNQLDGGTGNDTMTGGTGNDTYVVDATGDVINETSVAITEIDSVNALVSYTLSANVENLTLTGTGTINGTGNSLNNSITGNSTHNQLDGGQGNDILIAYSGNDNLAGGAGDDSLNGGYGNDSLTGGAGNDTITGGYYGDRFIYDTNAAFSPNAVGIDRITDFTSGTDKIVLDKTTFTALGSVVGGGFSLKSEFAVVGSDAAAASVDALMVYSSETGNLFYNQNGVATGLGSGAQFATLSGIPALSGDDFILQA